MARASKAIPAACPYCSTPALSRRAAQLTENGMTDSEIAGQCATTVQQLTQHRQVCSLTLAARESELAVKEAKELAAKKKSDEARVSLLDDQQDEALAGDAIVQRLNAYLKRVEELIEAAPADDLRGALLALDQARKTCETMSKLYLDIMKAQLDASVQSEFRRIVMEAINAADPATRQRIIAEIQSRAAVFGTLGGAGL